LFAAERKRATWTRRCEEKLPKALSRLSYQVKDSEKFGLGAQHPKAPLRSVLVTGVAMNCFAVSI
jgi:hypothetical protein